MAEQPPDFRDAEINMMEPWRFFMDKKRLIILVTLLFVAGSVLCARSLPDIDRRNPLSASDEQSHLNSLGRTVCQLGVLTLLAVSNLRNGHCSEGVEAIEILKSWFLTESFPRKQCRKVEVFGVTRWYKRSSLLVYSEEMFDPAKTVWLMS
jgi:hypothetical protein